MQVCAGAQTPCEGFRLWGWVVGAAFQATHTLHGKPCTERRGERASSPTQFIQKYHIGTCWLAYVCPADLAALDCALSDSWNFYQVLKVGESC